MKGNENRRAPVHKNNSKVSPAIATRNTPIVKLELYLSKIPISAAAGSACVIMWRNNTLSLVVQVLSVR